MRYRGQTQSYLGIDKCSAIFAREDGTARRPLLDTDVQFFDTSGRRYGKGSEIAARGVASRAMTVTDIDGPQGSLRDFAQSLIAERGIPLHVLVDNPGSGLPRTLPINAIMLQSGERLCPSDLIDAESVDALPDIWGLFAGTKNERFRLVKRGRKAIGLVTHGDRYWRFRTDRGVGQFREIHDFHFHEEVEFAPGQKLLGCGIDPIQTTGEFLCPDVGPDQHIDLGVFYTPAAQAEATLNGDDIETLIIEEVMATNLVFDNSLSVSTRVLPYHLALYPYNEAGISVNTTLFDFANDTILQLVFDDLGIDSSMLVVFDPNSDFSCQGIAFIMPFPDRTLYGNPYNYSVMRFGCFGSPTLVMAHELGHTLSGQHEMLNCQEPPYPQPPSPSQNFFDNAAFPWSYGAYALDLTPPITDDGYSSVMAYSGECMAQTTGSCVTVPYFSDESIVLDGDPLGDNEIAHNARSIGCLAPQIAAQRDRPGSLFDDSFE